MVGNLVLLRRMRKTVKRDSSNEYGYPHSNALLQFHLELDHCKLHKTAQRRTSSNEM